MDPGYHRPGRVSASDPTLGGEDRVQDTILFGRLVVRGRLPSRCMLHIMFRGHGMRPEAAGAWGSGERRFSGRRQP